MLFSGFALLQMYDQEGLESADTLLHMYTTLGNFGDYREYRGHRQVRARLQVQILPINIQAARDATKREVHRYSGRYEGKGDTNTIG